MRRIMTCLALTLLPLAASAQNTLPPQPPRTVEGQPIETRAPEKADDKPLFPEQTRAPYHASAPFKVTTLVDNLHVTWGMAFLPDGRMLLTERLPGALRILDRNNVLSPPLTEIMSVAAGKEIVLLDVAVDPHFAANHRIFFTFCDFVAPSRRRTTPTPMIARARLDGDKLSDVKVIFRAMPQWPAKGVGGKTGGRIVFGPDGNLFVTIGDRDTSPQTPSTGSRRRSWTIIWARSSTSRRTARPRPAIPLPASRAPCPRSGPWACAARKAWPSIPRPACCGKASWGRAAATRSTSSRRAPITAGR